eukprot:TRINITY_DN897_c0_g1_i2.p2 TRINITY_DN897_c0_g1~~TRINITY_DN897_c0_g1_i2.p2  ORF type:complete len:115 (-),score=20.20 TRINITY_DN897_c0_g1_i2:376-720(-)
MYAAIAIIRATPQADPTIPTGIQTSRFLKFKTCVGSGKPLLSSSSPFSPPNSSPAVVVVEPPEVELPPEEESPEEELSPEVELPEVEPVDSVEPDVDPVAPVDPPVLSLELADE